MLGSTYVIKPFMCIYTYNTYMFQINKGCSSCHCICSQMSSIIRARVLRRHTIIDE